MRASCKAAGSLTSRALLLLLPVLAFGGIAAGLLDRSSVPVAAATPQTEASSLGKAPSFDVTVPAFTDADVTHFTTTLDAMLAERPAAATSIDDARIWTVARGLQTGLLTAAQESRVDAALTTAGRKTPSSAALAGRIRHLVDTLTVGKAAPEIAGRDLDGTEFRLSDYRGKVVALIFSGDWCGICRTQLPYERLLLDVYKNWPFAILGVDSDADRDATRKAMIDRGIAYRTWWDGYLPDSTGGPIATDWNVTGWPTDYVIDGNGVIRFVDLRQEDLLKGVRELLTLQPSAPSSSRK